MNTGYKIIWSNEADQGVDAIITYLENNWSQKEADNFLAKLKERISLISRQPESFRKSEILKNARRSVLTKRTIIYYTFENDYVEILYVFDTRQNPAKLNLGE